MMNKQGITHTKLIAGLLVGMFALAGCQSMTHLTTPAKTSAAIKDTTTQANMGEIKLRPVTGGVQVYGNITGLTPNSIHAIHIHANPSCADKGNAAGGHFNPTAQPHNQPTATDSHSGDMPNIIADSNGVAKVDFVNPKISLTAGASNSAYNHAIIVHAGVDDYTTQPTRAIAL